MSSESLPCFLLRTPIGIIKVNGFMSNPLIRFPSYKYCRYSGAVTTVFESRAKNDVLLKDEHNFYNFDDAKNFKFSFIYPSFNLYFASHTIKGASIETTISWQSKQFNSRSYLGIADKCRTFHELTDEQLFKLYSKYLILMLNQNYKFECNEYRILEVVFRWMINYGEFPY